jgi:hypothetical protein
MNHMNRKIFIIVAAAFALAAPLSGYAQQSDREREQERVEREREQAQEKADQAREKAEEAADRARDKAEEIRERAQERAQEARDRAQERRERERNVASSLDTTLTFDARGTVSVSCRGGAVIVTGSDRNEIKVHAPSENGGIRFTSNGMRATLEPSQGRDCGDGRFEITVPAGTHVSAVSWSGSVSVHGVHGDVESHTQSADIDVRDAGRLELETMSGDVTVQGAKGDAAIHTVSGNVSVAGVEGDLELETVSGDLGLRDVVAKQVRTHTTSGDVDFDGQILEAGHYEFNTHSGEIRLTLPPNVGAQLSISTFSGSIDSDFPITLRPGDHSESKRLNFTLGQGSARILAETFSGDVNLKSTGRR